jgi:hypothetical protein
MIILFQTSYQIKLSHRMKPIDSLKNTSKSIFIMANVRKNLKEFQKEYGKNLVQVNWPDVRK